MTVRTRLVTFGAILPTVVLVVAVLLTGWMLRTAQLRDLDRRLLTQAAVESVGLFDGTDGTPHVHLPSSPIASAVAEFAPLVALYDAEGRRVVELADPAPVPPRLEARGAVGEVQLGADTGGGRVRRTLELGVVDKRGKRYTLWLAASLAPVEQTMSRYYRTTFGVLGVLGVILLGIQLVVARRLASRIETMIAFLPHLHTDAGTLPPDPSRDELATLRDVLRVVADRLGEARLEQDRLLASAAHELRTPLTVLRTEVDLALRKDRSAEELRAALRRVRADVDRIADLAAALLDLQAVRHVAFHRRAGDLAALLHEACRGLRTTGEARGIRIALEAPPSAPAELDERALRQAIDNLVGNALKHAPPSSVVEVALARHDASWRVTVADRGPGVPAEAAERIFEPFQRLATDGAGAGLGLAIAREVAQRHGGGCWLDTGYRDGARFVLAIAASVT